jgi:hypothetical protein
MVKVDRFGSCGSSESSRHHNSIVEPLAIPLPASIALYRLGMVSTDSQIQRELDDGAGTYPREPLEPTLLPASSLLLKTREIQAHLVTIGFVVSAIGVAAWTARMAFDPKIQRFALTFPDSFDYFDVARLGPLRIGEFFFGRRPIGYPLFIWALGGTPGRVVTAQVVLYALAWLYLISTVLRIWRSRIVGGVTAVVLLLLGLHPKYSVWSVNTLSEGLAITSSVAAIAAWLRWVTWPDRRRLITVIAATLAWISLRDSNAVNMLAAGGGVFGLLVIRHMWETFKLKRRFGHSTSSKRKDRESDFPEHNIDESIMASRSNGQGDVAESGVPAQGFEPTPPTFQIDRDVASEVALEHETIPLVETSTKKPTKRNLFRSQPLALALAIFLVWSGYQIFSQTISKRGKYATYNNIGRDVLPSAELSKFFFENGMPNPPALAARAGKDSWGDGPESFLENPQLAEFRKWADRDGRNLIVRALIMKSPLFWKMLAHDWKIFNGDGSWNYDTFGVYARTPKSPGRRVLVAPSLNTLLFCCAGGFIAAIALMKSRRDLRMTLLGGLLSGSAVFDIYLCFVGDADERYRHIICGYLRLDLAALLAVSWAANLLVCRLSTIGSIKPGKTATT